MQSLVELCSPGASYRDQPGIGFGRIDIRKNGFIYFNPAELVQMGVYDAASSLIPVERQEPRKERPVKEDRVTTATPSKG